MKAEQAHPNINYMRRQLLVQIHRGKAFTSHLLDQPTLPGHTAPTYTVHLSFRGQRFRSEPKPCANEPDIRESFLLELHLDESKGLYRHLYTILATFTIVLALSLSPFHLFLLRFLISC